MENLQVIVGTETDDGDHENLHGKKFRYSDVYDIDGTLYGDCHRKAVDIREIRTHLPWHSSKNPMIFSYLPANFTSIVSEEEMEEAKNSIEYTKFVNSSYG